MQQKTRGLFWILLWCITFTCGVTISKFLSTSTDNFSLFCMRYLCGMLFFTPIFLPNLPSLKKLESPLWLHLFRAVCIGTSSLLTYQTYRNLPISIATSIGFTGPLLASSFGIFFLSEKPYRAKILALILGYIGVLCIVQPHYIPLDIYYVLTGLGACILAGLANTLARKISYKDPAIMIMLTSTLLLGAIAVVGLLVNGLPENPKDLILLGFVGFFGSMSQFAYIKAVSYAEVSFISPFEYTRLLLAVPIGFFMFGENINPGQLFGMALIVVGSIILSKKSES